MGVLDRLQDMRVSYECLQLIAGAPAALKLIPPKRAERHSATLRCSQGHLSHYYFTAGKLTLCISGEYLDRGLRRFCRWTPSSSRTSRPASSCLISLSKLKMMSSAPFGKSSGCSFTTLVISLSHAATARSNSSLVGFFAGFVFLLAIVCMGRPKKLLRNTYPEAAACFHVALNLQVYGLQLEDVGVAHEGRLFWRFKCSAQHLGHMSAKAVTDRIKKNKPWLECPLCITTTAGQVRDPRARWEGGLGRAWAA